MNSWKGEFSMTNTKKKHGNKMKLMSAIGMLTVSAAMLVSSTFAWFSMNKHVTASTMSIEAKSDSTFLLIGTVNNAGTIQTAKSTSVTNLGEGVTNDVLIPSSPVTADDLTAFTQLSGSTAVTTQATAAVETNWWTANSSDPANATQNTINIAKLSSTDFSDYVIKKTVYLTVAVGSNQAKNLTITPSFAKTGTTSQTDYSGVKVLVATSAGGFAILDKDTSSPVDISGGTTQYITDQACVAVDLYIYYDGKDSTVTSNNFAKLAGANVTFAFDVDVVET